MTRRSRADRLAWGAALGCLLATGCTLPPGDDCAPPATASPVGCTPRSWRPLAGAVGDGAFDPRVVVTSDGAPLLVYLEARTHGGSGLVVAEAAGSNWSPFGASKHLAGHAQFVDLALCGEEASIVWQQNQGADRGVFRAHRQDGAWRFPRPDERLSFGPPGDQPAVALGGDGEEIVIWNQERDGGALGLALARRPPRSEQFERPRDEYDVLSLPVAFTNYPKLARSRRGDVLVTWYQSIGAELRVFYSERRGSTGSFSLPSAEDALSPSDTFTDTPWPAIGEDGFAAVLWHQGLSDGATAMFLATRDPDGLWHRPASLDDRFSTPAELVWRGQVAITRDGHLYAVWQQHDAEARRVLVAHRDRHGDWLAPGREPLQLSGAGRAIDPRLAWHEDGTVAVVWSEQGAGGWRTMARVSSTKLSSSREVERWSEAAALSPPTGESTQPDVALGGGRVVVAWSQAAQIHSAVLE